VTALTLRPGFPCPAALGTESVRPPAKLLTGRSQIAAAFLESLAGDRVRLRSAGPEPVERVNSLVVQVMVEVDIDLTGRTPRQLTDDTVAAGDTMVTASGTDV